jgi:hypothetical protein
MLSIWCEKQRVRRGLRAVSCGFLRNAREKNAIVDGKKSRSMAAGDFAVFMRCGELRAGLRRG